MTAIRTLDVILNDRTIGSLALLGGDRNLFSFNDTYIEDLGRETLSLSFKDQFGDLIVDIRPTQTRIMPFFANLLPEGAMRDYLANQSNVDPSRDFFVLWALGEDLTGAIAVRSSNGEMAPARGQNTPSDAGHRSQDERRPLRFSLAGVQLKFSAVLEATGGLTIPVDGVGGSWIVKLPSAIYQGVPENEFAMMSLAKSVGIDVPEISLISVDDIQGLPDQMRGVAETAFAIKRFDRSNDGKPIHIEDFAQVFGVYPERKYQRATYRNIAEVVWAEIGATGIEEFIRRLTFNALIGNADMHLKNWSLMYPDGRTPELAPAYDYVSTIAYLDDSGMALNVARTRRFDEFNVDELAYLAAKAKLPRKLVLDTATETVDRFVQIWGAEQSHIELPIETISKINAHLITLPLVSGR
jgi:serine/threonine-protein kinase HipA